MSTIVVSHLGLRGMFISYARTLGLDSEFILLPLAQDVFVVVHAIKSVFFR